MTTEYPCGCESVNGLVTVRCAEVMRIKATIEVAEKNRHVWLIENAATALQAHYPSKFTAPQPCGPVEAK